MAALLAYSWPGNVRELSNTIYQLVILSPGSTIRLSDLPDRFRTDSSTEAQCDWQAELAREMRRRLDRGEKGVFGTLGQEIEFLLIDIALEFTNGHKQKAAEVLGLGRNTLTRKLKDR